MDRPSVVNKLRDTLRESVTLRLMADVPLGLFLSGGIDSGVLATIVSEYAPAHLRTISVGFDSAEFDETSVADAVAKELGAQHSVVRVTSRDIIDDVPSVLAAIDQPTVDGFNTFIVSRAAKRAGLTVALSGLGGDELFGGYASFRDVPRSGRLHSVANLATPILAPLAPVLARAGGRAVTKALELLSRPTGAHHRYFLRRELFVSRERRRLHALPHGADRDCGIPLLSFERFLQGTKDFDPINQVSRFEMLGYMRYMLLRDSDVFSMANQIELRVPFLDHKFVELALSCPGRWKTKDPRPKPLLIDAAGTRFPHWLSRLPKKGFTFPWRIWLRGPLRATAERAVSNTGLWAAMGFDPRTPFLFWKQFLESDKRLSPLMIVSLIVLHDYIIRHSLAL
jgi:asparagine synthase (glutamine-hydrolysing)